MVVLSLKTAFFFRKGLTKRPTDASVPWRGAARVRPALPVFPCVSENRVYFCAVCCWVEMFFSREISFIFRFFDLQLINFQKLSVIIKYLRIKITAMFYNEFMIFSKSLLTLPSQFANFIWRRLELMWTTCGYLKCARVPFFGCVRRIKTEQADYKDVKGILPPFFSQIMGVDNLEAAYILYLRNCG